MDIMALEKERRVSKRRKASTESHQGKRADDTLRRELRSLRFASRTGIPRRGELLAVAAVAQARGHLLECDGECYNKVGVER